MKTRGYICGSSRKVYTWWC